MSSISFTEQEKILQRELLRAFEYIALDDFYVARAKLIYDGDLSIHNIRIVLARANYNGAIARRVYYFYVHKFGFDVRALWNALIRTWMFGGVWQPELKWVLGYKEELKKFKYPKWVEFGLIGFGLPSLVKIGKQFCNSYMEEIQ